MSDLKKNNRLNTSISTMQDDGLKDEVDSAPMKQISVCAIQNPEMPNLYLFGRRQDNGKWSLPGGHAEVGEDRKEAALRELAEEIGYYADADEVDENPAVSETINPGTAKSADVSLFLVPSDPEGLILDTSNDPDAEFDQIKWLDPLTLPDAQRHVPRDRCLLLKLLLGKSEDLEKMSRPRITFPNLKDINNRPDQQVQQIETNQQKEMYGHKVANAAYGKLDPSKKYKQSGSRKVHDKQSFVNAVAAKEGNAFGTKVLGQVAHTPTGPIAGAIQGKLRSKYEEGDDDFKAKELAHKEQRATLARKYSDDLTGWYDKARGLSQKIDEPGVRDEYNAHIGTRPQKPKYPRAPSKPKKSSTELSPEMVKRRGQATDATIEHEGLHHMMGQIRQKHGEPVANEAEAGLMAGYDKDTWGALGDFLSNHYSYKAKSPRFNEEGLAHARDILVNPAKREAFKQHVGEDKFKQHIDNLKRGHQAAYKFAQSYKKSELEKGGPVTPSKFVGLKRLKQIQTDNHIGEGGKEFDESEVHNAINERGNGVAQKMVRQANSAQRKAPTGQADQSGLLASFDSSPRKMAKSAAPVMPAPQFNIAQPHTIFSAENSPYHDKVQSKLSHEQTLQALQAEGEDAHGIQGNYGGPERSIIVFNPKNRSALNSRAHQLGQESILHSDGTNHELRYLHGPNAGKKQVGQGTQLHATPPADFYSTLPDGRTFTHNLAPELTTESQADLPLGKAGDPSGKPLTKFNQQVRNVADSYAKTKGMKLDHNMAMPKVDPVKAGVMGRHYEQAPHTPNDPNVQASYGALIGETKDQFHHMLNNGTKISKIKPGQANPYKSSADLHHDIRANNHMWYFPSEQGFGSGDQVSDHPMMQPTGHLDEDGQNMPANDMFRVVHDYFGHGKEGFGFGSQGEENAWRHHKQMYSPAAHGALTNETRMQNSAVNFGKHGENNRANPENTVYADQKASIAPDWAND